MSTELDALLFADSDDEEDLPPPEAYAARAGGGAPEEESSEESSDEILESESQSIITADQYSSNSSNYALKETDRASFNKANSILQSHSNTDDDSNKE